MTYIKNTMNRPALWAMISAMTVGGLMSNAYADISGNATGSVDSNIGTSNVTGGTRFDPDAHRDGINHNGSVNSTMRSGTGSGSVNSGVTGTTSGSYNGSTGTNGNASGGVSAGIGGTGVGGGASVGVGGGGVGVGGGGGVGVGR